jgi:hypothetical protein
MAMAEDALALQAMKPGGKEHQPTGAARRRAGDARRYDVGRASDARPHPRLHDLDHDRAGVRKTYNEVGCSLRLPAR